MLSAGLRLVAYRTDRGGRRPRQCPATDRLARPGASVPKRDERSAIDQGAQWESVLAIVRPTQPSPAVASLRRWTGWRDAATPRAPKRGTSAGSTSCACSMRGISLRPMPSAAPGRRQRPGEYVECRPHSRIADGVDLPADAAPMPLAQSARRARRQSVRTMPVGPPVGGLIVGIVVRRQQRRAARSKRTVGEELQPTHPIAAVRLADARSRRGSGSTPCPLQKPSSIARSSCGARTEECTRSGSPPLAAISR